MLFILILGCCACAGNGNTGDRNPGAQRSFEGRNYIVYTPASVREPDKAPAVFLLHGAKSNGRKLRQLIRFEAFAQEYGVVAVFPSAPGKAWNDGREVELGSEAGRDDAGYLARLASHLAGKGAIDPTRVYFAGISNGGGMAIRMACDYPELVDGIGVIATKMLKETPCRNHRPVPTAFFHGTEDPISPHDGRPTGREGLGGGNKGKTLSSAATIAWWADRHACSAKVNETHINPVEGDNSSVNLKRFTGCDAPLVYYEIEGGGHTWPGADGAKRRVLRLLLGPTNRDISANREMLELWFSR